MKTLSESKKERNERIKFVLLVIAFVLVSISVQKGKASELDEPGQPRLITLSGPEGQTEKFSSEGEELIRSITTSVFNSMGISLSEDYSNCSSSPKIPIVQNQASRNLASIINWLNDRDMPRKLNEDQMKVLKEVPACPPYLAELKVISKQLSGWNLVQVEYL